MNKWQLFYNSIKADSWPDCPTEEDFDTLPKHIQQECINDFGYVPNNFLIKQQLTKNKSFCVLPFIHLYINEYNKLSTCCYGTPIKQHSKSFEFQLDSDFEQIRTSMHNGKRVKECKACYSLEDNSVDSPRIANTIEWANKLNISNIEDFKTKLRYYDIRNDNLCNLACRTCHPGASTQLEKEYKKLKWIFNSNANRSKLSEIIDYDTVEKVYVAGGEPTVMPEFTKFLETAISKGRTDIELMIITNTTNLNKNILMLLKQFTNISFTLSLDGYDQVNRYIRWPSDWATIKSNIEKIKSLTTKVFVNVTVSVYNITKLNDLVMFLETVLPNHIIMLSQAKNHPGLSPFNFPNKELAIEQLELLKLTNSYSTQPIFREKVDYFINMIKTYPVSIPDLAEFFKYNDALDASRGIKLADYIPELEECRKLITKQISNTNAE